MCDWMSPQLSRPEKPLCRRTPYTELSEEQTWKKLMTILPLAWIPVLASMVLRRCAMAPQAEMRKIAM